MTRRLVIAIDGPAGAGKSAVSAKVAAALGYVRVDTGAMYRAVALAAMDAGIALDEHEALGAFAEQLVKDGALRFEVSDAGPHSARPPAPDADAQMAPAAPSAGKGTLVRYHGRDISAELRTPAVSLAASAVARVSRVRDSLLQLQRKQAQDGGIVLEGRDIGTVVFPNADLKVFLTASPEVRAERRYRELVAKGTKVSFEETLADVKARDEADETREISPLRRADDAILVDSSALDEDAVVVRVCELARQRARA